LTNLKNQIEPDGLTPMLEYPLISILYKVAVF